MALIGLKIPPEISRLLANIKVPGERDSSDHLTMFYMKDDLEPKDVAKICRIVPDIINEFKPFDAKIKKVTCFPKGDDGVPIIGEVDSKELLDLRKKMATLFDKEKVKYSDKFPDFKPHITLSYSNTDIKNIKIGNSIKWMVTEIILWSSNKNKEGDNGITVNFPLYDKISSVESTLHIANTFCKLANV